MDKDTSAYLDCARFLAAFSVLLVHVDHYMMRGILPGFQHIGFEAVGAFFTLSGFVIGYVTDTQEKDFKTYFISRTARLYSVVIPCLALTFLLDAAGRYFAPIDYGLSGSNAREAAHILFSLTFLNQSWLLAHPIVPGSDGVFWTLGLEAPFYVVFGIAFFLRGIRRVLLLAATCCIVGPVVFAIPLWLAGVLAYRIVRKRDISISRGRIIFLATLLIWFGSEMLLWRFKISTSYAASMQASFWLICGGGLLFAVSIIGFHASRIRLTRIAPAARWLAGASFTLYLLHGPFLCLLDTALPRNLPHAMRLFILLGATLGVVFLVAEFTERRKDVWRRKIQFVVNMTENLIGKIDLRLRQPRKQQL